MTGTQLHFLFTLMSTNLLATWLLPRWFYHERWAVAFVVSFVYASIEVYWLSHVSTILFSLTAAFGITGCCLAAGWCLSRMRSKHA